MRSLLTWNIQGGGRRIAAIMFTLNQHEADVLVLTEYRRTSAGRELSSELSVQGWTYQFSGEMPAGGYGALIASRLPMTGMQCINEDVAEPHRMIEAEVGDTLICGLYLDYDKRMNPCWEALYRSLPDRLARPAAFLGDFNSGRHHLDEAGATFISDRFMKDFEAKGMIDSWRSRHSTVREYSWHTSKSKNGFRLDHVFATPSFDKTIASIRYSHAERENKVSDHSALIVTLGG